MRKNSALAVFFATFLIFVSLFGCKPEPEKEETKVSKKSVTANEQETTKSDETEEESKESTEELKKQGMRIIRLYFADKESQYLVPEERKVSDSSKLVQNALEELLKGPKEEELTKTVPEGTKIQSVNITGDTVVVNFSREFVDNHPKGSAFELMTVYSIVDTVTELSGLKKVKFLVEGQNIETLAGHLDLTEPVKRDETLIRK